MDRSFAPTDVLPPFHDNALALREGERAVWRSGLVVPRASNYHRLARQGYCFMSSHRLSPGSGRDPPSSTATSRSLLQRVKADEAAAWERLVGLYAPLVFHWCRRWGLREPDVADILQEVFQAVVAHIAGFRKEGEGDSFRAWLHRITRNKVVDHFRRLQREPPGVGGADAQARFSQLPFPQSPEEDSSADEPAERGLFLRALELIRREFEVRTWQAFWRTAVEGQSPREVAEALSMSAGAVRVAKCRVLHRLREELGDLID